MKENRVEKYQNIDAARWNWEVGVYKSGGESVINLVRIYKSERDVNLIRRRLLIINKLLLKSLRDEQLKGD